MNGEVKSQIKIKPAETSKTKFMFTHLQQDYWTLGVQKIQLKLTKIKSNNIKYWKYHCRLLHHLIQTEPRRQTCTKQLKTKTTLKLTPAKTRQAGFLHWIAINILFGKDDTAQLFPAESVSVLTRTLQLV